MGKAKIIFGIILIVVGIALLFFLLALGITLISAGVSAIVFHNDEDTIEERLDSKKDLKQRSRNK